VSGWTAGWMPWRFSAAEFCCILPNWNGVIGSTVTNWVLAIYREFGSRDAPGLVFFLGNGLLEVSGRSTDRPGNAVAIWIQVRDMQGEYRRLLNAGVLILREPRQEAWGLMEMWIADLDGVRIVLVEVPDDHPLRRDQRDLATLDD
jgi:hypothetical protein